MLLAIGSMVCAAVFAVRSRMWQRALRSMERQFTELKTKLGRAEQLGKSTEQTKDALTEDYEQLRKMYQKVLKIAYTDANTDLPNRQKLVEEFDSAKEQLNEGEEIGLAVYSVYSDTESVTGPFGRSDTEMKQEILQRLRSSISEEDDLAAALGEDSFALLTKRIQHRRDYEGKLDKLFKMLTLPMMSGGVEVTPVVYGAVAVAPGDGDTMQLLEMNLGLAMSAAKRRGLENGESAYCFYSPNLAKEAMNRMSFQASVTEAVRAGRLEYPLTPRMNLAEGTAEQLVISPVLQTPDGPVGGRTLLELVDGTGLTMVVYEAMLNLAADCLHRFAELGLTGIRVAVPVTERMFGNREFVKEAYDCLATLDADTRNVLFELPESVLTKNAKKADDRIRKLCNFGVHFTLETAGFPNVPVGSAAQLPIDYWRPVGAPEDFGGEDGSDGLLKALADAAHAYGAGLILTGVNDKAQEDTARRTGVDVVQGSLYGEAMSTELAVKLLTALRGRKG